MKQRIFQRLIILILAPFFQGEAMAQPNEYCDNSTCLFLNDQSEDIDSQLVVYATNVWSIDEWDNAFGCAFFNQCENLRLKIYYPKLQPGETRPLVVLIHGGGFITGDYTAFQEAARNLAKLGYVAATIDYRLCKRGNCLVIANTGCLNLCNGNFFADFATSAYVATVDANNAIRYLQQNAAQFHIDPDNVIVGGHSAGAFTALNVAYMDQDEANAMGAGWAGTWGNLNPVSGIKGVMCLSGAMLDTSWIDADERYPVFILHGTCDPTVCYDADAAFHCNSAYPKVFGGSRLARRLQGLGIPYYFFSGIGMGHDISPLVTKWYPESLRFFQSAMLCGEFMQKHVVETNTPESVECGLLQNDAPGCNLQFNHAPLPTSNLTTSAIWGGAAPPCGQGLVGAYLLQAPTAWKISPTVVHDFLQIELEPGNGAVELTLFNTQGVPIKQFTFDAGSSEKIDLGSVPAGVYFVLVRGQEGSQQTLRIIKI